MATCSAQYGPDFKVPKASRDSDINIVNTNRDLSMDYAPLAAERLRPGDHIAIDFEPIQWFSKMPPTQHYGVSRYLRSRNGPEIAYMGTPILGGVSLVLSALTVSCLPYFVADRIAMLDPLVETLYSFLERGNTVLTLQPLKAEDVYVAVKASNQPVPVLGLKSVNSTVLHSLSNYIPASILASVYSSLDVDDDSRAILSHIIVQAAD